MSLVENLTTKAEGLSNREYSIYTGFENLEKYPPGRPTSINCVATLELMKSAFVSYSMTGRPITFASNDEMDIMNLGFAHIKNIQKFTCVIDEPLVIQTAFNYFKRNSNDVLFLLMSQTNFNASMAGLIWEKIVVNFLRKKLFESNTALSESGMFLVKVKTGKKEAIRNYNYLPEDFERPPQLLPYGDNCMGRIAVESTTADNYLEWLRAVAEWEKTGNVPKGFCPICYPPNMAGPDISIAFFFPRAEDDIQLDEAEDDMQLDEERKSYILNVQVKLRKKAMIKESFRTVEPNRMFIDKNGKSNPPKANATLNKIYKDQGWFDRNMKMIVVYPCNPQRKGQYQQTSGASRRKSIIPRVIIDMENASTLFPDDCQEWIQEYKKKIPDDWDCSDIEDEK